MSYIRNLKRGDLVKFVGAGPNCTQGVVRTIDGQLVYLVSRQQDVFFEIERYREEITERLAENQPIPLTPYRLMYLLETAAPESDERKRLREAAQAELLEMVDQGQVVRNNGDWCVNIEWRP